MNHLQHVEGSYKVVVPEAQQEPVVNRLQDLGLEVVSVVGPEGLLVMRSELTPAIAVMLQYVREGHVKIALFVPVNPKHLQVAVRKMSRAVDQLIPAIRV